MASPDDSQSIASALRDAFVGQRLGEFAHSADSGLVLRFSGLSHELRIAGPFTLGARSSHPKPAAPGTGIATELLMPVLEAEVTDASVDSDGALALVFAYLTTLRVPSAQTGKAWQVRSEDGLLIVSGPGGEITLWEPPSTPTRATAPR